MIDHRDLNEVVEAIVKCASETGYPPTIRTLADMLFMSRGANERRIDYLRDMGLVPKLYRKGIYLNGGTYIPPLWAGSESYLFEKMPQRNKNLSRSNNGSQS